MPNILILKLRLRRKRSGGSAAVPPPASYYVATPHLTAGQGDPEPVTPVLFVPAPPTGTTVFPPLDPNQTPFLGSEWSGFPNNLGVPFPRPFLEVGPNPPVLTLNRARNVATHLSLFKGLLRPKHLHPLTPDHRGGVREGRAIVYPASTTAYRTQKIVQSAHTSWKKGATLGMCGLQ